MGIFFFRGGVRGPFFSMVHFFRYKRPNRSGVGAIDNFDLFEHVFDPYYIQEVLEKIFASEILVFLPPK